MSVFTNFISAAIEQGSSYAVLRDCKAPYVLEEEQELFESVRRHAQRYGELPSAEALHTAGFRLPTSNETVEYYLDRLKQRYVYNVINDRHPALREALRSRDTDDAMDVLREMIELGNLARQTDAVTSLTAEASLVAQEMMEMKYHVGLVGVTFGWPTLDEYTLGAQGGDVIVLAGRPSMGKSWMLIESAFKAWQSGKSILFVSMEMAKKQIVRRWMGRHVGINPNYIRRGQVNSWAEEYLTTYSQTIASMPRCNLIAGDMEKNMDGIEAAVAEYMPDMIYIDAAYLLTPSGYHNRGIAKWEAISKVIGQTKQIAIRYDRPVFETVQFNRNVKNNATKEPDLSDIGGSDSIPQDASIVLGARMGLPPFERTRRRISVMKNREGEVGEFHTDFSFSPPNMGEVDPDEGTEVETSWMV